MGWWLAVIAVLGLWAGAIARRSSGLSFVALAAFMPLALYTVYEDFGRIWVLMLLALAVEVAALARYAACPMARRAVDPESRPHPAAPGAEPARSAAGAEC